jgi:transposase
MSGDWKRNYGANCDTGMGESRRQTVQPRSLRSPRQSSTLLARWLRERGVEAYVIHPSSIAVSREHRRAKTDRLDMELLMRAFLGWLRGERRHCSMAAIPTIEEEDTKRPNREREKLIGDRTRIVNGMKSTLSRFGIRGFKPTLRPMKSSANCAPPKERFCLRIRVRSFVAT